MDVQVVPRRRACLPGLDESQEAVLGAVASGGHVAVVGAPGSGKTTVALAIVARELERAPSPERVLLLTATRRAATQLGRDLADIVQRTMTQRAVVTPMALSFDILRRQALALGAPTPQMITGPEQDAILAGLLRGHEVGEGRRIAWPPSVPPAARSIPAFRAELRDLLMRAAENGIDPLGLDELGREHGVPEWQAAAQVYQEYLDTQGLRGGTVRDAGDLLDAATMIDQAARALATWDEEVASSPWRGARTERPRWDLVVVDDFCEATAATRRLLGHMADDGARIVMLGCPDTAVQTYRGALPGLLAQAADPPPVGFGAELCVLQRSWRQGSGLRAATSAVVERIRPGRLGARGRELVEPGVAPEVRRIVVRSAAGEAAAIARLLREARLDPQRGLDWEEMAVIVRSRGQVAFLREALAHAAVPIDVEGPSIPVRDEAAARPLLEALRCVTRAEKTTARDVLDVATSPLVGLDSLGLRRLRRFLRASGGQGDEAIEAAVENPDALEDVPPEVEDPARRLRRAAAILDAGRAAAGESAANAATVLYAMWQAAGVEEAWRRRAIGAAATGDLGEELARAARADRDLDAVVALLDAAGRYAEKHPRATAGSFADVLLAQEVPLDTLAPRASGEGRVFLGTAASAAGREFKLAVVASVHEGTWPDLRLRDSLMGAGRLADLIAGRPGTVGDTVERRRQILDDELRSFALAISRASEQLVITAVASEEERPSVFFTLLGDEEIDAADPAPPHDLRGLVAAVRSELIAAHANAEDDGGTGSGAGGVVSPGVGGVVSSGVGGVVSSGVGGGASPGVDDGGTHCEDLARILAELAHGGVQGAHPDSWAGLVPTSSKSPLFEEDEVVSLSPSKLETLLTCPLRWALEKTGGVAASSAAQSTGALLHALAAQAGELMEEYPASWQEELRAEFARQWAQIAGDQDTWHLRRERAQTADKLERLIVYLDRQPPPLAVEAAVDATVQGVRLRGSIDRVEQVSLDTDADLKVRVVDFKSGATRGRKSDARTNPQLGAYQAAINAGALDTLLGTKTQAAGAALAYLSQGADGPTQWEQPSLASGGNWMGEALERARETSSSAVFEAVQNPGCRTCGVKPCCPAMGETGQVTT